MAEIPVEFSNVWETHTAEAYIPDGVNAIYLTYRGEGNSMLNSFAIE
ncbi:MAG: hypothetical protein ACI4WS_09675 [Oscillospiraceae bacterium]